MSLSSSPNADFDRVFQQELLPHLNALSKFAFRLTQDADDAEDLVQVTYMNAYRAVHTFKQGTNGKAWLFRILKNAFFQEVRKYKHQFHQIDFDELDLHPEDSVAVQLDFREEFYSQLLDDELTSAINSLNVNYRLVLLLYDMEGFTYEEISKITDVPIGTVRSRLHRARSRLKVQLEHYASSKGINIEGKKKK